MDMKLSEDQTRLVVWLVEQYNSGSLPEEFSVKWKIENFKPVTGEVIGFKGKQPKIGYGSLMALENAGLILTTHKAIIQAQKSGVKKNKYGDSHYQFGWPEHETGRSYVLLGEIFTRNFFEKIVQNIESREGLSSGEKQELKDIVEHAKEETREDVPNENLLTKYINKLALMAPDILDVIILAAGTPKVGPIPVAVLIAKKVAEKVKRDSEN